MGKTFEQRSSSAEELAAESAGEEPLLPKPTTLVKLGSRVQEEVVVEYVQEQLLQSGQTSLTKLGSVQPNAPEFDTLIFLHSSRRCLNRRTQTN